MKDNPASLRAGRASITVAVLVLLTAITISARGQSHPLQPPDHTNSERIRQQQMAQREWELRNLANEPGKSINDPRRKALIDQVEQDFKRILIIHNEFARSLAAGKPLDYISVSEGAGEIKKRASRLQNTLALPKPDGDEQNQDRDLAANEAQIKAALIKLCKHIERFVNNPIIATPGTIDAKQSTRARHDLEGVIETSDSVKKSADKLKNTAP